MIMRGTPGLLKAIQSDAAKVSKANGINTQKVIESSIQGGAAFSSKIQQPTYGITTSVPMSENIQSMFGKMETISEESKKFDFEKSLNIRLIESIETLQYSKEYFNALQSMITLYAIGSLTEGVMRKITNEDLSEIKGILNEFKSILDSF